MKNEKIIISINGKIHIPDNVCMKPFEIADLFDVFVQTVNANIKAILKSKIVRADISDTVSVAGNTILPDHYGLDMVIALAFRIDSHKTKIFREWVLHKAAANISRTPLFIGIPNSAMPN